MCSGRGDWTCLQPGFPIRKSSDHSLVIDSPRLIADSYVLLRFLVPRHPPCALKNLSHKDARVHCVVLNIRAVPHLVSAPTARLGGSSVVKVLPAVSGPEGRSLRPSPQDPTTCQAPTPCAARSTARGLVLARAVASAPNNRCSTLEHLRDRHSPQTRLWTAERPVLLRKEVIQPHLPVRLPCYDLVPIASPTFDGSLHKGWATGFGCYRLS
jgi:hypothetical protein